MATRGQLGGLARATDDARIVLDAAGIDVVLIETVGVGQGEIDVSRIADVSVVVLAPGGGDDVQAIKAGIMEIADVFVVNKADRDGADRAVAEIEGMLSLREPGTNRWRPPVVKTCAATGEGVDDAIGAVRRFADRGLAAGDRARRRARARLEAILVGRIVARIGAERDLDDAVDAIAARKIDPYAAAGRSRAAFRAGGAGLMKAVLDHIGIAVDDLDAALAFYSDALGLKVRTRRRRSRRRACARISCASDRPRWSCSRRRRTNRPSGAS